MEGFSTMKTERLTARVIRDQAIADVHDYIERYFLRSRRSRYLSSENCLDETLSSQA